MGAGDDLWAPPAGRKRSRWRPDGLVSRRPVGHLRRRPARAEPSTSSGAPPAAATWLATATMVPPPPPPLLLLLMMMMMMDQAWGVRRRQSEKY